MVHPQKVAEFVQGDGLHKNARIVRVKKVGEPLILIAVENNVGLEQFIAGAVKEVKVTPSAPLMSLCRH